MQTYSFIYAIGAAQGFILAIALWRKTTNNASNKVLSVWLLFLAFDLSIKVIYLNNNHTPLMSAYLLALLFPFLYGSFFYLYVRTLVKKQSPRKRDFIHFAVFILFVILNFPTLMNPSLFYTKGYIFYDAILFSYSVTYVVAGVLLVNKYRNDLKQQKVDVEGIDLKWLMIMSYCQIVIWLIGVSQWLLALPNFNSWTIYIAVSVWIIITGYLSLSQQSVPELQTLKKPTNETNDARFDEVKQKLDTLFVNDNIHLQPSLTIGQLAQKSGYPEYLISLFINRIHQVNFRDYINDLRIQEAIKKLKDNNKTTILDIAYECGFNSKSTFNSAFKKITGQTPSQFKQQQLSD